MSKPVPPRLPPPRFGKLITMLSIDGGGIRGLIPAVVLARLEEKLQDIDGPDARIADYFDVIAGTSTGALLAALLVTPNPGDERPLYPAKDIKQFYIDYGPSIFHQHQGWRGLWQGPKYDGEFLHKTIEQLTSNKNLAETLTRVVVPTFDVNRLVPVIFSSFEDHLTNEKKIRKEIKPNLSDVCIGTSAAPTFFPAHYFEAIRPDGMQRSVFHLVDGGVAANNPTLAAIMRITREQLLGNPEFHPNGVDYKKYLILSVGTGAATNNGAYTATGCAKWNRINWVRKDGHNPIIDMFSHASDFLVDFQVSMLLYNSGQLRESYTDKHDQLHSNYLRIQAKGSLFKEPVLPMDDTSDANMKSLVGIGETLLENKVARVDLIKGTYQTDKNLNAHKNDTELYLFAKLLAGERELRLKEQEKERAINKTATTSGDAPLGT
ncbi:Patatin group A-3 [Hordeum vulgare]|nr:Patatin group A-3 [Hordeum vulgare]